MFGLKLDNNKNNYLQKIRKNPGLYLANNLHIYYYLFFLSVLS